MATSEHIGAAQAADGAVAEMDAVILVGGRGTRLRPLTVSTPKPMLPTAGYPFLAHLLARIKAAGMHHVVLGTSYKAEVFEEYFGDGSEFGLEIEYVVEEEALGTGGGDHCNQPPMSFASGGGSMPAPLPLIRACCSVSPAGVASQSSCQAVFSIECVQASVKAATCSVFTTPAEVRQRLKPPPSHCVGAAAIATARPRRRA